ncbi:MAG: Yip1 family protein, partial [Hyphomonadaceae bacterium]
ETNIPSIMLGYVAPLAAIPPICGLIGAYIFGFSYAGVDIRPPLDQALVGGLVSFVASVAMVFFLGLLINSTAEQFDGDRNDLGAQKVAAYSMTPSFLSGVFSLWPPLWWLSLLAIAASVFLLYRGLPILMKSPEDRALGYTATVAIAGLVAFVVLFSLSNCVTGGGRL